MSAYNIYRVAELQAHLLFRIVAQKFLTEVNLANQLQARTHKKKRENASVTPDVIVDLSPEAKEVLMHRNAPYL